MPPTHTHTQTHTHIHIHIHIHIHTYIHKTVVRHSSRCHIAKAYVIHKIHKMATAATVDSMTWLLSHEYNLLAVISS